MCMCHPNVVSIAQCINDLIAVYVKKAMHIKMYQPIPGTWYGISQNKMNNLFSFQKC